MQRLPAIRLKSSIGVLMSVALTACAVGPDYHSPTLAMPEHFSAEKEAKAAQSSAQWWKSLNDPVLDDLIDKAITANPKLEIALDHVQQAREHEMAITGTALPAVEASAGMAKGTGSDLARGRAAPSLVAGADTTGYEHVTHIYGFDAVWELDLFGKYRREAEAADADTHAMEAARNDVLVSIIADLVRSYTNLRGLQMQQVVLARNIKAADDYTHFVQQRYDRGITNGLDLTLAQRQLSTLKAEAAPLDAQVKSAAYTIAVLCGAFPEDMVAELSKPGVLPMMPEKLATGVPVDLLRQRPDIREAERELAAATARIGSAKADLFPRVTLSGGAGYQAQGFGVSPSMHDFIWSAGPGITMPLLDFGTLDALVNAADYQTHAKLMQYKQTVLDAVAQVDSASEAYAAQQQRLKELKAALEASQHAVYLAGERYDRGLTDSLNIIDAQRQQFGLEQQYIVAQQEAASQFVTLHKVLGRGWEQYQTLPDARIPAPAVFAILK